MNQTALITGAAKRIGAQIARRLHATGVDVAIHFNRSAEEAETLCRELNALRANSAIALQANLATQQGCESLIQAFQQWRSHLNILVNNASTFERTPFGTVTEDQWTVQMEGNLKAAFFVTQSALALLRHSETSSVINICDARWDKPLPEFSAYAGAKAGMVALTRCLSVELAPAIRVNAVGPGSLDWPNDGTFGLEQISVLENSIPLKRIGSGDDIADAIIFLSQPNSYITGQILNVDGGISAVSV